MIRYRLHDLVDVLVDEDVPAQVRRSIEFQLAPLRSPAMLEDDRPRLVVRRYADRPSLEGRTVQEFHGSRVAEGEAVDSPHLRLAVVARDDGLEVFSDGPGFLINLYLQLLILPRQHTMVHAAAVVNGDGEVTLMPGPGGVGKTAVLGHMVGRGGWKALGDDIVVLGPAGRCLAFPRAFVLKEYHRELYPHAFRWHEAQRRAPSWAGRVVARLASALRRNAPFVGVTKALLARAGLLSRVVDQVSGIAGDNAIAVPLERVLGEGTMAESGTLSRIVYMTRYEGDIPRAQPMTGEELADRTLAILQHEWSGVMRHLYTLGAAGLVDVQSYFLETRTALHNSMSGVRAQRLLVPTSAAPEQLFDFLDLLD